MFQKDTEKKKEQTQRWNMASVFLRDGLFFVGGGGKWTPSVSSLLSNIFVQYFFQPVGMKEASSARL